MFGAFTYVGAALRLRFGFDFATVGAFLAAYCVGGLAYVTQSARLYAVLGNRRLPFAGSVVAAASFAALALTGQAWMAAPLIGLLGLGFYMLHNTLQTMATQMAPEARGSAVAIFATFYFLSQAVGVQLAGHVIDLFGPTPVFLGAAAILLALGVMLLRLMPASLRAGAIRHERAA